MSSIQPVFAQQEIPSNTSISNTPIWGINFWMISNLIMIVIVVYITAYTQLKLGKLRKSLKFEEFKVQDLSKRLKLALVTIKKMETNPDLVHSREFNLDYLRMRMDEEMFHSLIVNRLKIKITQIITVALRPDTLKDNIIGIVGRGREINEMFDVTYEIPDRQGDWKTRVLFRVQIKLTKLPLQSTTSTINQILDCLEHYLSPKLDEVGQKKWQPMIQGQLVKLDWDQNAKPTPLLVLEQSEEGISFATSNQSRVRQRQKVK